MPELRDLIARSNNLVVFTGAGISAESGIPTYRGKGGLWNKYDPDKYANIDFFREDPTYFWRFFRDVRFHLLNEAQPNPAHLALVKLEESSKLKAIITQNIDGLHQQAGSGQVVELHGSARRFLCLQCSGREGMVEVFARLAREFPPFCISCGGQLRPETVFFGELLSTTVLVEAVRRVQESDLFIVIGSSLVVQPAAQLPVLAKENGGKLVIINNEPTPLDALADLVYHSPASEVLSGVV